MHNFLKIVTGISLVAIPFLLFTDTGKNLIKTATTDLSNSMNYASDQLGASGGQSLGNNSEIF